MDQPNKAKGSRPAKSEVATPKVAPPAPPEAKPKAADKPSPDARPTRVYVTESGLTIEEY